MVTDGSQTLTHRQVLEAELADWRQVLGRIKARFRTRNFATGLELVNRIGAAAGARLVLEESACFVPLAFDSAETSLSVGGPSFARDSSLNFSNSIRRSD